MGSVRPTGNIEVCVNTTCTSPRTVGATAKAISGRCVWPTSTEAMSAVGGRRVAINDCVGTPRHASHTERRYVFKTHPANAIDVNLATACSSEECRGRWV